MRQRHAGFEAPQEEWRRHYPLFPRLLFVLDGAGPAGAETRIHTLNAAAADPVLPGFLRQALILTTQTIKGGTHEQCSFPVDQMGRAREGRTCPSDRSTGIE
ncbi:hypothetical protein ACWEQN_39570 [Streptomyces sp. NPDC004129]